MTIIQDELRDTLERGASARDALIGYLMSEEGGGQDPPCFIARETCVFDRTKKCGTYGTYDCWLAWANLSTERQYEKPASTACDTIVEGRHGQS